MRSGLTLPVVVVAAGLASSALRADDSVDYVKEVKPLLAAKCLACHGALRQKADLRLDTVKSMREGGEGGAAVVPGKPDQSLLVDRVLGRNHARRMPPASDGEPLSPAQIALLTRWIQEGAIGPADEKPEADPREHWAFRQVARPPVPASRNAAQVNNPVDAFITAAWEQRGLVPQQAADRRTLLRRVTLDLIGLPPTPPEQEAFLADRSPDAFEKVVDRLLDSPHYGERWGQHWMDIWRYSDWWGLGPEVRNSQKHMWHWRDWIMEGLNADKGYDQMLREMLAADELYPNDLDRLRGTGFLARHYFRFNRTTWLDETIEHTSKALLGLTINCAKCHDHKYDPIPQADYYRLRAFFEPYQVRQEQVAGEIDFEKDAIPRVFDCNLDAPTFLFVRGDDRNPRKERPLAPALPAVLTWGGLDIRPVDLPAEAHTPGLRPHVLDNYLRAEEKKRQTAIQRLALACKPGNGDIGAMLLALEEKTLAMASAEAEIAALKARAEADRVNALGQAAPRDLARRALTAERRASLARTEEELARATVGWLRAQPDKKAGAEKQRVAAQAAGARARKELEAPGEAYTPLRGALKTPESNLETEASRNRPFPRSSTGRRAALARWMTDRRNPLTARVAVNHIWARHFGRPLVETVFDFGRKGSPPSHPALLDYLAAELMDHGWSMKHLHRLIVTTRVYRLSSSSAGADANTARDDPENRFYWRRNPQRMEAQVVRDSLLYLGGDLDPTLGGPSIPVADEASKRRSIYYFHSNNEEQRFLGMFDDASVRECYRRTESIVPQQALALANSKLTLTAAGHIAERLGDRPDDADLVRAAFRLVLAGDPSDAEMAECAQALREWRGLAGSRLDAARRVRSNLIHSLLNHNDFITIR
jgi:hypothetical protein